MKEEHLEYIAIRTLFNEIKEQFKPFLEHLNRNENLYRKISNSHYEGLCEFEDFEEQIKLNLKNNYDDNIIMYMFDSLDYNIENYEFNEFNLPVYINHTGKGEYTIEYCFFDSECLPINTKFEYLNKFNYLRRLNKYDINKDFCETEYRIRKIKEDIIIKNRLKKITSILK